MMTSTQFADAFIAEASKIVRQMGCRFSVHDKGLEGAPDEPTEMTTEEVLGCEDMLPVILLWIKRRAQSRMAGVVWPLALVANEELAKTALLNCAAIFPPPGAPLPASWEHEPDLLPRPPLELYLHFLRPCLEERMARSPSGVIAMDRSVQELTENGTCGSLIIYTEDPTV